MGILLKTLVQEEEGFFGSSEGRNRVNLELIGPRVLHYDCAFDGTRPLRNTTKSKEWLYKVISRKLKTDFDDKFFIRMSSINIEHYGSDSAVTILYNLFTEKVNE